MDRIITRRLNHKIRHTRPQEDVLLVPQPLRAVGTVDAQRLEGDEDRDGRVAIDGNCPALPLRTSTPFEMRAVIWRFGSPFESDFT